MSYDKTNRSVAWTSQLERDVELCGVSHHRIFIITCCPWILSSVADTVASVVKTGTSTPDWLGAIRSTNATNLIPYGMKYCRSCQAVLFQRNDLLNPAEQPWTSSGADSRYGCHPLCDIRKRNLQAQDSSIVPLFGFLYVIIVMLPSCQYCRGGMMLGVHRFNNSQPAILSHTKTRPARCAEGVRANPQRPLH